MRSHAFTDRLGSENYRRRHQRGVSVAFLARFVYFYVESERQCCSKELQRGFLTSSLCLVHPNPAAAKVERSDFKRGLHKNDQTKEEKLDHLL